MSKSRINLSEMLDEMKSGMLKMETMVAENLQNLKDYLQIEDKSQYAAEEKRKEAKTNDLTIRSLGDTLETKAVKILSLQAPVGYDLRFVLSSFRMIYDLERVSRDAYNAFSKLLEIDHADLPHLKGQFDNFSKVVETSLKLLDHFKKVYSANEGLSAEVIKQIIEDSTVMDNEIDEQFSSSSANTLEHVKQHNLKVETGYSLLSAIRSLERVGDHICNLIERALYIQTGTKYEIK